MLLSVLIPENKLKKVTQLKWLIFSCFYVSVDIDLEVKFRNNFNPNRNVSKFFHYTHHNIYNYGQHPILLNVLAMTCNGWIWHSSRRVEIDETPTNISLLL